MKWMETMGMSMAMSPDESAVWWHYLWVVPCTDLHRVPDSESTSALVSHKWPSSARTRCCSFCHRSCKSAKVAKMWFVAKKHAAKWWKLSTNTDGDLRMWFRAMGKNTSKVIYVPTHRQNNPAKQPDCWDFKSDPSWKAPVWAFSRKSEYDWTNQGSLRRKGREL